MTQNLDDRISYYESPKYYIAKKLKEKGYGLANCNGDRITEPDNEVIGILKEREPIKKSFLGIKWERKQRAFHVGNLWFDSPDWALEVCGREYIPELTDLVKELSRPYSVKVQVTLGSESVKLEYDYIEFDM